MIMIRMISPPMMTISLVEPISDSPSCCGVGVVWKNTLEEKSPCTGTGAEYVSAALSAASARLNVMAMMERTVFLIVFHSIPPRSKIAHCMPQILTCALHNIRRNPPNCIVYMYFGVLLKYNAHVAGGVQRRAVEERALILLI